MTPAQRQILRALPRTGTVSLATLARSVHGEATPGRITETFVEVGEMWVEDWVDWDAETGISLTDAGRAALDEAAA